MSRNSKILIVDDNIENLSILGNILINKEYSVQVSLDGKSAIKAIQKKLPDLVLLDINMPGLSGFDVCKILKEDEKTAGVPIIFLTAHTGTENIVEGFSLGAVDYVTKPFQEEELLSRVKTHLELKHSKTDLERKNNELKKINATKDKLFSIIAHDLRGPLSTMMSIIDLVSDENETDELSMYQFLQTQKELTLSTYNLLNNLLDWARHSMDNIKFEPDYYSINDIVNENIVNVKHNAANKEIEIYFNNTEPRKFYGDIDMINLIMRNLLLNAIKFTPNKGSINIYVDDKPDELEIIIEDTGIGIKVENIEKILSDSEFYSSAGTNNELGTGLGLKLVKSCVSKNNGSLNIKSELNKGSRFSFTLPKEKNHAEGIS